MRNTTLITELNFSNVNVKTCTISCTYYICNNSHATYDSHFLTLHYAINKVCVPYVRYDISVY